MRARGRCLYAAFVDARVRPWRRARGEIWRGEARQERFLGKPEEEVCVNRARDMKSHHGISRRARRIDARRVDDEDVYARGSRCDRGGGRFGLAVRA